MSYSTVADVCKNVCWLCESFPSSEVNTFEKAINNIEDELLFGLWCECDLVYVGENERLPGVEYKKDGHVVYVVDTAHPSLTSRNYVVFGESRSGVELFLRDVGFTNIDRATIKNVDAVMCTF